MKRFKLLAVLFLALALFASGCGTATDTATDTETASDSATTDSSPAAEQADSPKETPTEPAEKEPTAEAETKTETKDSAPKADTSSDSGHYPVTLDNCGFDITFDKAPERVMLMTSVPIAALDEMNLLDRVITKAGEYPEAYYSDELNAKIAAIPSLSETMTTGGGVVLSLETILDAEPDFIFGYETETITRDALAKSGIELYIDPAFCRTSKTPLSKFENMFTTIEQYGQIFDAADEADVYIDNLAARIETVTSTPVMPEGSKAAALYVESDGGKIWAYGPRSMTHPQMEALGATNIFEEYDERVFDVSIEELIDRDPDMLILLYGDPDLSEEDVLNMLLDMPGTKDISAVKNGQAFPHLFNFSEPASPLAIDGLYMLRDRLGASTPAPKTDSESTSSDTAGQTEYPYTFENCGIEVTLEKAPERLFLMNSEPIIPLDKLGVFDRVTYRAGEFPEVFYTDELNAKISEIPLATSSLAAGGAVVISAESILEADPDFVFGYETETVSRDTLDKAGVKMFTDPSFCKGGTKTDVSYDNIYSTIEMYGHIFDRQQEAQDYIEELKARIEVTKSLDGLPEGATAAALYVASDGDKIYAYGPKSMAHPQIESLGARNVFEEMEKRVASISIEELIDRDPDMLILLYRNIELHSEDEIVEMLLDRPGADKLTAAKNKQIFPHLFNYSEPASPLVIDGLEMLFEKVND